MPKQTILAPDRETGCKPKEEEVVTQTVFLNPDLTCPFCLYVGKISKFRVKTKKGYSEKRFRCPDCGNMMQKKSLTRSMTVEEYAEWVFMYSLSGFWQKCPFNKFNSRLRALGISWRFWKRYKELKGEGKGETYQEYLDRKQREWAKEQGLLK